ncbi:hypothetical protein CES86_3155 [Brucella lupini]|uniref:Uncharacterized protein n=1 Tax=Brucella lupini TaxID=255457 RepID=A0A256GI38_9HYPH|nr:hypothetical protein CES86_3155 [Brucella lupini]
MGNISQKFALWFADASLGLASNSTPAPILENLRRLTEPDIATDARRL